MAGWFDQQVADMQQPQAPLDTSKWSPEAQGIYQRQIQGQPQTAGAPGPTSAPTGQPSMPIDQAIAEYKASHPFSANATADLFAYLQAQGYDVEVPTRAGGTAMSHDKIVDRATGRVLDQATDTGWIMGAGAPSGYWADGKPSATPFTYTPFPEEGGGPGDMSGAYGAGAGTLGNLGYAAGSALAPWTQQFNSPTGEQAMKHPGFQYALDRGQEAIQRSAAAKGTLLTGGTLRGLQEHAIGTGLQQYGNLRDWMRDDYMIGRDNFYQNQDRPFNKLTTLGELGRPA